MATPDDSGGDDDRISDNPGPGLPDDFLKSITMKALLKLFWKCMKDCIQEVKEKVAALFQEFMSDPTQKKAEELNKRMTEMCDKVVIDLCDSTKKTAKINPGDTKDDMESKFTFCMLMTEFIRRLFEWLKGTILSCMKMIFDAISFIVGAAMDACKWTARKVQDGFVWTVKKVQDGYVWTKEKVYEGYVWTKEAAHNVYCYVKDSVLGAFSSLGNYFSFF